MKYGQETLLDLLEKDKIMPNAIFFYRIQRWLYIHHIPFLPKLIQLLIFLTYNTKITADSKIGKGTYFVCKDGCHIQRLGFLLKGVGNVKYAQFIQEKNGLLTVHIVPDNNYSDENRKQIEQNITDQLGEGNIDFEIKEIEEKDIIYTYRGKFKYLINLMLINQGGG